MYRLLLVAVLVFNVTVTATESKAKKGDTEVNVISHGQTSSATKNNVASLHNITYVEKAENMLRTPNLKKYNEDHKKKKKPKKTPKRTIQKIIKKNRAKLRKVYFTKKIKPSTRPPPKVDYDKLYGQEENKQWREERTTTPTNQRRKTNRKYSPKLSGYHMPFQKLQKKDKRHKRGLSRELYILKDLDEIEFLSKEGDDDVVKAHVKNFW